MTPWKDASLLSSKKSAFPFETKQSAKIGERDEPGCHFKHTSNHFMSNRRNREVFLIAIVHTRTSRQLGDKLVEIKGRIACA